MNSRARYPILGALLLTLGSAGWSTADAADEGSDGRWNSSIYLYLWGTSLNGTAAVRGNEAEIDESFSDLVENLAGAFSARFESHKGKWGYLLDAMYVKLDPSADTPAGSISSDVKQWIVEGAGTYAVNPSVQALFGVRYQDMQVDLNFPGGRGAGGSADWTDGFVGLRLIPVDTDKWRLWLRGDVGIVGDSETTWNAAFGARYNFSPKWSGVLAYRYLSNDYEDDDIGFKWDVDHSGLALAVGYSF